MKTITLDKNDVYRGNLILVNPQYPLRTAPGNDLALTDVRSSDASMQKGSAGLNPQNILMQRDAANILQLILDKISAGDSVAVVSGYRSAEEQTDIYAGSLKDNGEDFTRKFVALPGHSEHQTGLAVDLALNGKEIDFIRPDFPYTGICSMFRKTAPDYGFIERYPADKENITGISHEPWHFRYVGYPHSKIIEENGFTLEEYTDFIKSYREDCPLVYNRPDETGIEIFYIPAETGKNILEIPKSGVYQISGNNFDGFIITVWRRTHE